MSVAVRTAAASHDWSKVVWVADTVSSCVEHQVEGGESYMAAVQSHHYYCNNSVSFYVALGLGGGGGGISIEP